MSDPTKFRLNQQRNGWVTFPASTKDVAVHAHVLQLLGGLAIGSIMGVLYMINRKDVNQAAAPVSKTDAGTK